MRKSALLILILSLLSFLEEGRGSLSWVGGGTREAAEEVVGSMQECLSATQTVVRQARPEKAHVTGATFFVFAQPLTQPHQVLPGVGKLFLRHCSLLI